MLLSLFIFSSVGSSCNFLTIPVFSINNSAVSKILLLIDLNNSSKISVNILSLFCVPAFILRLSKFL